MRKLGPMIRRVLTAVSLLLFVAVLAAWVRGYWWCDQLATAKDLSTDNRWERSYCWAQSLNGEIAIGLDCFWANGAYAARVGPQTASARRLGFSSVPAHIRQRVADIPDDPDWFIKKGGQSWRGSYLGVAAANLTYRLDSWVLPSTRVRERSLAFPCWLAALVFGASPSWRCFVWWRGVRRRRLASREGRCGVCGYDLRASPQRCPECGTVVGGEGSPRSHGGHGEEGGEEPPMNADSRR